MYIDTGSLGETKFSRTRITEKAIILIPKQNIGHGTFLKNEFIRNLYQHTVVVESDMFNNNVI